MVVTYNHKKIVSTEKSREGRQRPSARKIREGEREKPLDRSIPFL
jgi:hypothetical protein